MPGRTLPMIGALLMLAGTISAAGTPRAADETVALFLPEGWHTAGSKPDQYDMGAQALAGAFAGVIRCKYTEDDPVYRSMEKGFGTLMQSIGAGHYRGKRLELAADLKTEAASGMGSIWMRVDRSPGQSIRFDNMGQRRTDGALKGTVDWSARKIVLDVPDEATSIHFGVLLQGSGKVWVKDFHLREVSQDVALTVPSLPDKPVNLDLSKNSSKLQ